MAVLSISNSELKSNLATVMGLNRDATLWDADTIADVNRIIRSGRRKFFSANDWSFLTTTNIFLTIEPQTTGTITAVNGVVTIAGNTWPTTAAGQRLVIDGVVYEINTRDSATQVTLHNLSVDAAALSTYILYHTRYALPTNFAAFISPVTVEGHRAGSFLREMAVLPDFSVRGFQSRETAITGRPELFAVHQAVASETGIPTYSVELYPLPDLVYAVSGDIRINPGDSVAETSDVFHASFAELMQEAILSAAEQLFNHERAVHSDNFDRMLPDFVRKDRVAAGARRLPMRTDNRSVAPSRYYDLIVGTVDVDAGV